VALKDELLKALRQYRGTFGYLPPDEVQANEERVNRLMTRVRNAQIEELKSVKKALEDLDREQA
jgi:hypothetical protein